MGKPTLLDRTANRLGRVAGFMAFELERYREVTGANAADDFSFGADRLTTLALCRRPRQRVFREDVEAISKRVGAPITIVANLVRGLDAVPALANIARDTVAAEGTTAGLLTAARDHTEEHTVFEQPWSRDPFLPGWLAAAVDRFWGDDAPRRTFPRDLDLSIVLNLPVAIIEMEGLTVGTLNEWFQRHRLQGLTAIADRPLRGCTAAYAGVGVIFVDRADEPDQRRVTVAHEASHFILDYLLPREGVVARRPELLDVLDGQRSPTDAEQFDALLADVPIGFHTHLLERDLHGGHLSSISGDVEDRAERMALELLAPLQLVLREAVTNTDGLPAVLRSRFGLPIGAATRYAIHIKHFRSQSPRSLLDAIGLDENTGRSPADTDDQP